MLLAAQLLLQLISSKPPLSAHTHTQSEDEEEEALKWTGGGRPPGGRKRPRGLKGLEV